MTTENFLIKIQQTGAESTGAAIDRLGASAKKSADIMGFFRKALVAFSALRLAENVVGFVDTVNRLDNRLRVATKSSEQFARAQQFISEVSRRSGTDLEGNTIIYSRLLQSTEKLKLKTSDLEQIMRGLSASIKVGGATSQEARNAMIQFSQSLASGALRGDELRSVAEQLPALANAIGKEFKLSGGELLAFAKANPGILETKKVLDAVRKASVDLEAQAAKMPKTMVEGLGQIRNKTLELLREVNNGTGIFSMFTASLIFLADNLRTVIYLLGIFAAIKLAAAISPWIVSLSGFVALLIRATSILGFASTAMALFNRVVALNPVMFIVSAIAALIGVFVVLYSSVPAVKAFFDGLFTILFNIGTYLVSVLTPVWDALVVGFSAMMPVINSLLAIYGMLFQSIKNAVLAFVEATGGTERWAAAFVALGQILPIVGTALALLVSAFFAPFILAAGAVVEVMYAMGFATEATVNSSRKAVSGFIDFTTSLVGLGPAAESAKNSTAQVASAVEKTGGAASATSASLNSAAASVTDFGVATLEPVSVIGKLNTTVNGVATSTAKAADNFGVLDTKSAAVSTSLAKTDETLDKLNPNVDKSYAAIVRAGDGYSQAAPQADQLAGSIRSLAAAYRDLAAAKVSAGGTSPAGGTSSPVAGQRAAGGPVSSGSTYLVGEEGPELFTPKSAGRIVSNDDLVRNAGMTPANDNGSDEVVRAARYVASAVTAAARKMDGGRPIPGDENYSSSMKSATSYGLWGGASTRQYDMNKPLDRLVTAAKLASDTGSGGRDGVAKAERRQMALIDKLSEIRENTAAFSTFTKALPGMKAQGGPNIDFQTQTPLTGGKDAGRHDPYGLMSRRSGSNPAESANPASSSTPSEKAGDTKINVNFFVKDAQSFRQNQAQVDSVILGAVKRGQRRVGAR